MAKIKDIIKLTTTTSGNVTTSEENSNIASNEFKLSNFEDKIYNKTLYQQKTIKSLLDAINTKPTTTASKDANVFRNIKTTINSSSSNLIALLSTRPTVSTATSNVTNKSLNSIIEDTNKSINIFVNNEESKTGYNCTSCNRSYNDNEKLKRHINNTHKKEKKFECNLCSKKYFINLK